MSSDDIRRNITLVEDAITDTLITQKNVLSIDMSPYDFSILMKEYRATDPTYNKIGTNAMVMFYTEQEKEDFIKFLKSRGVGFQDVGDE